MRGKSDLTLTLPVAVILLGLMALVWGRPLAASWQANLGAISQARIELSGYLDEGWSLFQTRANEDLNQPVGYFEQSLALDPEQSTANLRLGLIWLARGEYERAVPLLEDAYRLRPELQAARQALGEVYVAVGRLEEAAALWAGVDEAETKLGHWSAGYRTLGDEARAANAQWVIERLEK